jgi:BirA family transcriptional regulator, biotin operon repressor / biotin---[acetyl-CoA-carboxylase] ligase
MSTSTTFNQTFPRPETLREALRHDLPEFGAVEWLAQTGSTNADLIECSKHARSTQASTDSLPWLLGAHLQTDGKGRAGRPWQNESGACLMFSCAFAPRIELAQLSAISPALGVATCRALQETTGLRALKLKWPNDLMANGAKLAGLLIETTSVGTPHPLVVIGMGLNLTGAATLSTQLERPITDLSQILDLTSTPHTDLSHWAPRLVTQIARAWQQALTDYAANGYAAFADDFARMDALYGQTVQVVDQGKVLHQGLAQGTDAQGRLNVLTPEGVITVLVGDVSVRHQGLATKEAP